METFDLYTKSIVIDMGSAQVKAGFCTEEVPKLVFESIKSSTSAVKVLPVPFAKSRIGLPATSNYFQKYERVVDRGLLTRLEHADALIGQILEDLKAKNFDETSILFCTPLNAPVKQSAYLLQHCMEKLILNGVSFLSQPLLPLFAQGMTTGVAIELGEGLTQTVAMVHGNRITRTSAFSLLGGKDVDAVLAQLLRFKGHDFNRAGEFVLTRQIKEKLCRVRCREGSSAAVASPRTYTCPDGEVVSLGGDDAYAPEVLFDPSVVGSSARSVPHLIENVFANLDIELVRPLAQSILVSGETRNLEGLTARLNESIQHLDGLSDVQVLLPAPEKRFLAWSGAAKLSLNTEFFKTFIKKFEWEEFGESLLQRRFL